MRLQLERATDDVFQFTINLMSIDNDLRYHQELREFEKRMGKKHKTPHRIDIVLDQETLLKPLAIVRARVVFDRPTTCRYPL